jgi:hypothetical protein
MKNLFEAALIEGAPAATGTAGVGIPYLKTLAREPVVKIDHASVQVIKTRRVDKKGDTVILKGTIVGPSLVKGHAILEAGTPARFDEDAKQLTLGGFLRAQGPDFIYSTFG